MDNRRNYWKDMTGRKFHRLVVLSESDKRDHTGAMYWKCKCDCGNHIEVLGVRLRNGSTQSCGCLRKDRRTEAKRLPNEVASFNAVYSQYKNSAKRRKLIFSISEEDFKELTQQNCFYCSSAPSRYSKKTKFSYGNYIYNGLDRVNSSKGYTKDNVVPCCTRCNKMKLDMTVEEFKDSIKILYENFVNSEQAKKWMESLEDHSVE